MKCDREKTCLNFGKQCNECDIDYSQFKANDETVIKIYTLLEEMPKPDLEQLIEMTISSHHVKKGKVPHIRKIINAVLMSILEYTPRQIKHGER